MQKKTLISIVTSLILVGGIFYLVVDKPTSSSVVTPSGSQNVEMREGVQYVTVTAKVGYSPRFTSVKSGIPTKLIVKTNETYDCSLSLVVRSVGFQKILQSTGEEVIDLGILKPGEQVRGVCGMGMYNFLLSADQT